MIASFTAFITALKTTYSTTYSQKLRIRDYVYVFVDFKFNPKYWGYVTFTKKNVPKGKSSIGESTIGGKPV